jgi:hypothetical protein
MTLEGRRDARADAQGDRQSHASLALLTGRRGSPLSRRMSLRGQKEEGSGKYSTRGSDAPTLTATKAVEGKVSGQRHNKIEALSTIESVSSGREIGRVGLGGGISRWA